MKEHCYRRGCISELLSCLVAETQNRVVEKVVVQFVQSTMSTLFVFFPPKWLQILLKWPLHYSTSLLPILDELRSMKQLLKLQILWLLTNLNVLVIFGYQSINWFWTFNLWTLKFYSWEGKKWVKTLMRSRSGGWFRIGKVLSTLNDFGTLKEPLA